MVYFVPIGEELKRSQESYNDAQRKWIDNMISACQVNYPIGLQQYIAILTVMIFYW